MRGVDVGACDESPDAVAPVALLFWTWARLLLRAAADYSLDSRQPLAVRVRTWVRRRTSMASRMRPCQWS